MYPFYIERVYAVLFEISERLHLTYRNGER